MAPNLNPIPFSISGPFTVTDCGPNANYLTTSSWNPAPGMVECVVCGQIVPEVDATRLTPAPPISGPVQQPWVTTPTIQTPNYWTSGTVYTNISHVEYKWLCHGCRDANPLTPVPPFSFPVPAPVEPVDVDAIRKDLEDLEQELR